MAASNQALKLLIPVSGADASGAALTTAPVTASTKPDTISDTPTALLDGLNIMVSLSWLVALVRLLGFSMPGRCEVHNLPGKLSQISFTSKRIPRSGASKMRWRGSLCLHQTRCLLHILGGCHLSTSLMT
jgi:hypothetical protein